MKHLIILIILIPMFMTSQSVSIGFDPAIALGTTDVPGYSAVDVQLRLNVNNSGYVEYGIFAEAFPEIDYYQWGLFYQYAIYSTRHCYSVPKLQLFTGIEIGQRFNTSGYSTQYNYNYGFNITPRYNIGKTFIEVQGNLERRPEWSKWVYSNYINIGINF